MLIQIAPLINVRDLAYSYPSSKSEVLKQVNFTLNRGELIYIRGGSGNGKSTFLKILNRLMEPSSGSLEFGGKPYAEMDVLQLRRKIQFVPQTPFLFPIPVAENLKIAASYAREKVEELMRTFNLPPTLLEEDGRRLSAGQAARICVIRSLLLEPELILLDEPTSALDPENSELFHKTFAALREKCNLAAVWVTHDAKRFSHEEGRHLVLEKGELNDN